MVRRSPACSFKEEISARGLAGRGRGASPRVVVVDEASDSADAAASP